jgi:hypothetical protein
MKTYAEKLKDVRWQKIRLEALNASGWQCQYCASGQESGVSLNVHHCRYIRGREPWEYQLDQLLVLCERCHKEHHERNDKLNEVLSRLGPASLERITGFCIAVLEQYEGTETPQFQLQGIEEVDGYALGCIIVPSAVSMFLIDDVMATGPRPLDGSLCDFVRERMAHALKHFNGPTLGPVIPEEK